MKLCQRRNLCCLSFFHLQRSEAEVIEQVVDLAEQIEDENTQAFVILVFLMSSDKFIDRDYAKSVRRYLSMTKYSRV